MTKDCNKQEFFNIIITRYNNFIKMYISKVKLMN